MIYKYIHSIYVDAYQTCKLNIVLKQRCVVHTHIPIPTYIHSWWPITWWNLDSDRSREYNHTTHVPAWLSWSLQQVWAPFLRCMPLMAFATAFTPACFFCVASSFFLSFSTFSASAPEKTPTTYHIYNRKSHSTYHTVIDPITMYVYIIVSQIVGETTHTW